MKTKLTRRIKETAATLLTTIIICGVLTVTVLGYLSVIEHQSSMTARSQSWNMAMALAEGGLEEALEHLNMNYDDTKNINNLNSNGWAASGTTYSIDRDFGNNNTYHVVIDISTPSNPTLYTSATVGTATLTKARPWYFFAAAGVSTDTATVNRAVKVTCSKNRPYKLALAAQGPIKMNGNNITTDSFASCDSIHFTNGQYNAYYAGSEGDVASNTNIQNAVNIGNANIYGHVAVGPNGTVGYNNNGVIGDKTWLASNPGVNVQPGWFSDDSNFTFPDTSLPSNYASYATPGPGIVATVTASYGTNSVTAYSYPSGLPVGTTVFTNATWITTNQNPLIAGTVTNTTTASSSSVPAAGTYKGSITTNVTLISSSSYPVTGSYIPPVATNTTSVKNSSTYPAAGTYIGSVTTKTSGNKTTYSYNQISGYTYNQISGYTYNLITSYSYPTTAYTYYSMGATYTTNYTAYTNVLYGGYSYTASSLSGSTIILGANVTLVLPNGWNMASGDTFKLADGASVFMYCDGTSLSIKGNEKINEGGYAQNLIVYCTTNVTSIDVSGNGSFTGVIVAPHANFKFNGGGKDTLDVIGAAMVDTIDMDGHMHFHYDTCLRDVAAPGRYLLGAWKEIAPDDVP